MNKHNKACFVIDRYIAKKFSLYEFRIRYTNQDCNYG